MREYNIYLPINIECLLFVFLRTYVKPDSKNLAFLTEYLDRIVIEKIGRKHLLSIRNLDENRDAGTYTCHASNPVGEYKENFHVQGVHLRIVLTSNYKQSDTGGPRIVLFLRPQGTVLLRNPYYSGTDLVL